MSDDILKFDVVIVGGGPAGMSAALWCVDAGMSAALIERGDVPGGQLGLIHNPIRNYIGLLAASGSEMTDRFVASLENLPFERFHSLTVESLDVERRSISLSDGRSLAGDSIILATGVKRRLLNVPGQIEFQGRGILGSGAGEQEAARGKTIVIVGGGDAALENAMILSEVAAKVIVVHRGSEFSARPDFVTSAKTLTNIEFLLETVVTSISGDHALTNVTVDGHFRQTIDTDLLLIRIGVIPNSELAVGKLETDARGYIVVDSRGATSAPGIFAVGDVANPHSPTISTAAGSAATAVKSLVSGRQS